MTTPAFADLKGAKAKPDLSKKRNREEENGLIDRDEPVERHGKHEGQKRKGDRAIESEEEKPQ